MSEPAELVFESDDGSILPQGGVSMLGAGDGSPWRHPWDVDDLDTELTTLASMSGRGGGLPWQYGNPWDVGDDVVAKLEDALVSRHGAGATSLLRYDDLPWLQGAGGKPGKPKPSKPMTRLQRLEVGILRAAIVLLKFDLAAYERVKDRIEAPPDPDAALVMTIPTGRKTFSKRRLLAAIRTAKALISIAEVALSDPPESLPDPGASDAIASLAQSQGKKNAHMQR